MAYLFDPLNILIIAVAVGVFWRLRSVLGTRTGHERPPMDRFPKADAPVATPGPRPDVATESPPPASPATPDTPARPVWQGFATEGSPAARGLEAIAAAEPGFAPAPFLAGAKTAYEMIIMAFASGDKATLKPLLARDVFEGFASAIDRRVAAGEKLETRFVGINRCDIAEAVLEGRRALITLRLVSELIQARLASDGSLMEGDPKKLREVTDLWTFARETGARDPNWTLVATGRA